jgi:hydroxypyruvate isomerase
MPRFAANLTMLFTEYPVPERFDRAAASGFQAVEFLFPYDHAAEIKAALARTGLALALFNLPVGDFAAGDRGLANDPARRAEFRDGVGRALALAADLGAPRLNCLVGRRLPDVADDVQLGTAAENLAYAAEQARAAGVAVGVEPLNPFDAPGFLLPTTDAALALLARADHRNLSLQYDVYHAQRAEGNLVATIERVAAGGKLGHVQLADSPARHQPGTGEINVPFVLAALDRVGYGGWIGLEYVPEGGTEGSLGWLREWGYWG